MCLVCLIECFQRGLVSSLVSGPEERRGEHDGDVPLRHLGRRTLLGELGEELDDVLHVAHARRGEVRARRRQD